MATSDAFVSTFVSSTMSIDLARAGAGSRRLAGLATDLLLIAVRMRDAEDLGDPEALRKLIAHYLTLFENNCRLAAVADEAVDNASYALVALLDETVLSVPGACRDYWVSQPLQLELFGEAVAGEEFYRRLERLAGDPQPNRDVIEVYFLALALGFEGKYRLGGAEQRAALIAEVGEKLRRTRARGSEQLSPHARRFETGTARPGGVAAALLRYGVAIVSVVAVAVTWAVVASMNASQASAVARTVQSLFGK
jgi:type VI secretion system protein ImpK